MAARKKSSRINLLPQEEFAASTLGRILAWILSTFRVLVIMTELIVILAFLSRFWLDARTTDLNEEIKQKQAIVAASADFEKEFRLAQKKLKIYSDMTAKDKVATNLINSISSYLPPEVLLVSVSQIGEEVQVKGQSFTERAIAQFIANLEPSGLFDEISLSQVDTSQKTQATIVFTLKLILKEGK